jgi:opacity protein-like surface antigen
MKKTLLLLCMLITYSLSFAQVEKGKWFAAGTSSLRLDMGKEKYRSGGTTTEYETFSNINFDLMAGYFVIDMLPVGLYSEMHSYITKDSDDGDKDKETHVVVGPFARYYFLQQNKLFPYAEGRFGIGMNKEDWYGTISKESIFSFRLGAGASYFFTENVGFDSFIGYDYDGITAKSESNTGDRKRSYSSIEINFGIVVTFGNQ